jgi:glutamate racemase
VFAHQITRHLLDHHDVKLVVVACNTASAAALGELQEISPVPVVGVIEPGVRSLVAATRNGAGRCVDAHPPSGELQPDMPVERGLARHDDPLAVEAALARVAAVLLRKRQVAADDAAVDTLLLGVDYPSSPARSARCHGPRSRVDSADETAFRVRGLLGELELAGPPGTGRGAPLESRRRRGVPHPADGCSGPSSTTSGPWWDRPSRSSMPGSYPAPTVPAAATR